MTRVALRLVLADDLVLFREALAALLRCHGCEILDQVAGPDALHRAVASTAPDLAVIDIRLSPEFRLEGLHAAAEIRRSHPGVGVLLLLSQYLEPAQLASLVDEVPTGVGYLLKERASGADFLDAVHRVAGGGYAFNAALASTMINGPRRRYDLSGLTQREREVLALMAQGRSNAAISRQLHLTGRTVEAHVRGIFQQLALPPETEHHRRVLAVLAYLRCDGASAAGPNG